MNKYINFLLLITSVFYFSNIALAIDNIESFDKAEILEKFYKSLDRGDAKTAYNLIFTPNEINKDKKTKDGLIKILSEMPNIMNGEGWTTLDPKCGKTLDKAAIVFVNNNLSKRLTTFFLIKKDDKWVIFPSNLFGGGNVKFYNLLKKGITTEQIKELHELRGWALMVIRGYPGYSCSKNVVKE